MFTSCILGIGYGHAVIKLYDFIFVMIQVWSLVYLGFSFSSQLPWANCDNTWNTGTCKTVKLKSGNYGLVKFYKMFAVFVKKCSFYLFINISVLLLSLLFLCFSVTVNCISLPSTNSTANLTAMWNRTTSASTEFWE